MGSAEGSAPCSDAPKVVTLRADNVITDKVVASQVEIVFRSYHWTIWADLSYVATQTFEILLRSSILRLLYSTISRYWLMIPHQFDSPPQQPHRTHEPQ